MNHSFRFQYSAPVGNINHTSALSSRYNLGVEQLLVKGVKCVFKLVSQLLDLAGLFLFESIELSLVIGVLCEAERHQLVPKQLQLTVGIMC